MQQPDKTVASVAMGALLVCGVTWLALPWLQSRARDADDEAAVNLERARRLLHAYDPALFHTNVLLDQFAADVSLADPKALIDAAADEYQAIHSERWKTHQPTDWESEPPRAVKASYGNLNSQIREGARTRADLLKVNERVLDEALAAADAALAVSDGNASARSHAEANRLKGVILFHKGLRESLRAALKRDEALPYRQQLVELSARAAQADELKNRVADDDVEGKIGELKDIVAAVERDMQVTRAALAGADQTLRALEQQVADVRATSDTAYSALTRLREQGLDFSDPKGAQTFERRMLELDAAYRAALRQERSLVAGAYVSARLDNSGDYLTGRYIAEGAPIPLPVEHGLAHYRNERAVLNAGIENAKESLDDMRADIARLQSMKSMQAAGREEAAERIRTIAKSAVTVFDELNRVESEAEVIEDKALDLLDKSARACKAAAGLAKDWVTEARTASQGLSSEAAERSVWHLRQQDSWMGGHMSAQVADALLQRAWLYYARVQADSRTADLLAGSAKLLQLKEADAERSRKAAEDAKQAGIKEVTAAMAVLETAHRDAGRHWTFVAQQAGANYLLALLDQPAYYKDAIAAYRSALKGRENEPYVQSLASQLKRLEAR